MDDEILTILQEECAEVIQTVSKIRRFGINDTFNNNTTNREHLISEVGDLLAMISLTRKLYDITDDELTVAITAKMAKLKKYSSIKAD
jgi:NTP pyrophosphatase (non-canonical NTP hydrolase)